MVARRRVKTQRDFLVLPKVPVPLTMAKQKLRHKLRALI